MDGDDGGDDGGEDGNVCGRVRLGRMLPVHVWQNRAHVDPPGHNTDNLPPLHYSHAHDCVCATVHGHGHGHVHGHGQVYGQVYGQVRV